MQLGEENFLATNDTLGVGLAGKAFYGKPQEVSLMEIRYTPSHEWVRFDPKGEGATVGISHHAQTELGEIVYVELPKEGQEVSAGQELAVVESTKAATDLYSPVSGRILRVNTALNTTPSLVNSAAEKEGWIAVIAFSDLEEIKALLSSEEYLALL